MTPVTVSVADGVATVMLDHPPVNILTRAVLAALRDHLRRLSNEPALRVLLLSASGRHFSAGADVGEHLPPHFSGLIPEFLDTVAALDAFPLPVIASVRGRCLGGGFELVLGADIVMASDTALFGQPEILLGVAPPAAAAWLPARCPRGVAADLVFTGDPMPAADAAASGLVRTVVPDTDLESRTQALAARISRHSAAALRQAKRMLRARQSDADAWAMRAAGDLYINALMRTSDAVEGLTAFVGKRAPVWSHR
jgi:cyclohexa-1,5-dienecarbonyl-CoA hydratase